MKTRCSNQRNRALTLLEVVVVLFILVMLLAMLLPALTAGKRTSGPRCYGHLRQIGLAFQIWSGDNNGKYPMEVSTTNYGVMELAQIGNATAVFQVMSNELSTPRILLCPKDTEHSRATNFSSNFTAKNISYFIGLDFTKNSSQSILAGDDNIEFGVNLMPPGLRTMSSSVAYRWSATRHIRTGNILFADGSVQSLTDSGLNQQIATNAPTTFRLVIP